MTFKLPTFAEIKALFFKDVASAVAGIQATIKHLEAIASQKRAKAGAAAAAAAQLQVQSDAHLEDAAHASSVAAKLTALVS